jgi:hypothetical protein
MSVDLQIFEAGQKGDLDAVKNLHQHGANIHMALMGATYDEKTSKEQRQVAEYAFENGAHLLFGLSRTKMVELNQTALTMSRPNSWFTRVKMVGGIGEVPSGTFKKEA